MADTKITALTALTGADPANDVIPIVDVNDFTMAASGTTKKISVNNILGCSGTATLASATISGDLTVDTNVLKVDTTLNRVGVVTATPRVSLDVASGDIYSSGQITWGGSSPTANQGFLSFTGGNAVIGSTGATALLLYTNGVERYRIASDGVATWSNVGGVAGTAMTLNSTGLGVGTSSIVNAAAGRGNVTIGGSSSAILNLSIGAVDTGYVIHDGTSIYLVNRIAAGSLIFSTNSTERLTIDSSGNVGIGVTPSAWASNRRALQVGGLAAAALALNGTSNVSEMFFNSFINTSASNVYAVNGRAGLIDFGSGGFGFSIDSGTQTAGAACNFTRAMTLDASGNLLVGVTSANASGGVLQLKSGITFPATQVASSDANTLDDYEEGTFTPTIEGTSTAGTASYSVQLGRYTKIGRVVQYELYVAWSGGTGTGDLKVTGLPFTANGTIPSIPSVYPINLALTAGYYASGSVSAGTNSIFMAQLPTGGGGDASIAYDAAAQLIITGTYTV